MDLTREIATPYLYSTTSVLFTFSNRIESPMYMARVYHPPLLITGSPTRRNPHCRILSVHTHSDHPSWRYCLGGEFVRRSMRRGVEGVGGWD